jgi:hypothetical protein
MRSILKYCSDIRTEIISQKQPVREFEAGTFGIRARRYVVFLQPLGAVAINIPETLKV